jgi:type II secretory pathway component PulK
MKTRRLNQLRQSQRGSILIIVLWVAFGLVALALYFAHSMSMELRAADNRNADLEAEQAIAGAARYVSNVLATVKEPGVLPDLMNYKSEAVPVGEATFWIIGRSDKQTSVDQPSFGLVDEGGKLNLNAGWLTSDQMLYLPRITAELAASIIDWRDTDEDITQGGAENETYQRLVPAYRCKNELFETTEELRLVRGADLDLLYGDDANLNGALDMNENDGDTAPPLDNRDSRLDSGLLEHFTAFSLISTNGTNVNDQQQLSGLLQTALGADRANEILRNITVSAPGTGGTGGQGGQGGQAAQPTQFRSPLEFYIASRMTANEFSQIESNIVTITTQTNWFTVNVNTASEAALACVPGIGTDNAPSLVSYRRSNPSQINTVSWVKDVLQGDSLTQAAPYLTGRSYQFTADIAAVGHHGRGYRRVKFVFDTSQGAPRIVYRQDLTHLGWALGKRGREQLLTANTLR